MCDSVKWIFVGTTEPSWVNIYRMVSPKCGVADADRILRRGGYAIDGSFGDPHLTVVYTFRMLAWGRCGKQRKMTGRSRKSFHRASRVP